jgi:predicted permease
MLRRGIREYLRLRPRGAAEVSAQVDEEIELHVELRTQELLAQGVDPVAARAQAEQRFGDVAARRALHDRAARRERRLDMLEQLAGWRQDFAYSARALARDPLPAAVIALTLGLGLGANATVFGMVDQLLLRPPAHVQEPEQVRRAFVTQRSFFGDVTTSGTTSYVAGTVLGELTDVIATTAVYRYAKPRIGRGVAADETWAAWATPSLFRLLGVQPALGRFFTPDEDRPGAAERVAVLEYGYWQAHFGGTPDALGRTLVVGDDEFIIIGVAPRGFTGPELKPARVWLPFSTGFKPRDDWPTTWNATWAQVLVRLQDGATAAQADARATAAFRAAREAAGRKVGDELQVRLLPSTWSNAGTEPPEHAVARWLVAVAVIVLLVACANVVNMLLARTVRRRPELAVRLALGVSRGRLVRLLLSESLLLAFAGGAVALALAALGGGFLRHTLLPDVLWDAALQSRVLLFSAALVLLTGIAVGLLPALRAAGWDVSGLIRSGSAQSGGTRGRVRPLLTALQAAFALVLLVGAAHFVRSLWNVERMDLGIDADRVLSVETGFRSTDGLDDAQRAAVRERQRTFRWDAVERLRARPDVAAATVAASVPMSGGTTSVDMRVPGWDSVPRLPGGGPYGTGVRDGYFETVGTPIVRGRRIGVGDRPDTEHVIVVNETMARTLWPGRDALGQCVHVRDTDDAPCSRVVGIAADARRRSLTEEPAMQYYVPLGQGGIGGGQILVRPAGNATSFIPELRAALHSMEPALDYANIMLLRSTLDGEMRPWRLGATMFLVFGALALVIAGIGLYSVIAYAVAHRRHELGVRIALGAGRWTLVAMIMREGLALVLLGILAGIPLALVAGRRIEALLFHTSTTDVATFAAVAAVLVAIAVAATVIPALRAGRTSPLQAMRAE